MKNMKKIICAFLILTCAVILPACGEEKKAETAVNGMFTAFKQADLENMSKYINIDELNASDDKNNVLGDSDFIIKAMADTLDYSIISSEKKDDSTVVVKTSITALDMKPVIGDFFTNALQYAFSTAFSDPQPTEEETNQKMEELFLESISKPDLEKVTNEVDIIVVKSENNNWKIEADETFVNALFGGLLDAAKEIEDSFSGLEE